MRKMLIVAAMGMMLASMGCQDGKMKMPWDKKSATTQPSAMKDACPMCEGSVSRVHRSLLDRLFGLFVSRRHVLYRYQCCSAACAWTGTLERRVGRRNLRDVSGSGRHVLDAARMSGPRL